jgi:hypothetical protein
LPSHFYEAPTEADKVRGRRIQRQDAVENPLSLLSIRPDHRFEFQKRRQLFIGTHNETLSVAAMRVSNEDWPPLFWNIRKFLTRHYFGPPRIRSFEHEAMFAPKTLATPYPFTAM